MYTKIKPIPVYLFLAPSHDKKRYCVIAYVGHFWPPIVGLISVRFLLYTPKSLMFTPISFLCLPPSVFSVCILEEHTHGAPMRDFGV